MAITREIPLARKLGAFVALSDAGLATLERLHARRRHFQASVDIAHAGPADQSAYVLARSWVCSYKLLPNGTRQIIDFQVPGGFLELRSVLLRTADHGITRTTKIEASVVLSSDLLDAFARTPA